MITMLIGIAVLYACAACFYFGLRAGREGERFVKRMDDQDRLWQREDWNEQLERRRKLRARFEGRGGAA